MQTSGDIENSLTTLTKPMERQDLLLHKAPPKVAACDSSYARCQHQKGNQVRENLQTVHGIGIVPDHPDFGDSADKDQATINPGIGLENVGPEDIAEFDPEKFVEALFS
jgi:hypothetical protein